MSNYDGASKALDDLRTLIIRDDSGLAPVDIVMLGHVAGRMEHTEMMLRSEQSKHIVKDTRKGEWPEDNQEVHVWDASGFQWHAHNYLTDWAMPGELWLPAPPPPTDD
jgi:hypothetical protein